MQYTVKAVHPQVRNYDTRYGTMAAYKVQFAEMNMPVEISQKTETPAPTVGQVLEGTVDMSGQFGPKFKKEYNQGGNFGPRPQASPRSSTGATGSKPSSSFKSNDDPFTMYLSYAKDLAVAKVQAEVAMGNETADYTALLDQVLAGAYQLYQGRPGADNTVTIPTEAPKQPEQTSVIDQVFEVPDEPMTEEDLPWPEPSN